MADGHATAHLSFLAMRALLVQAPAVGEIAVFALVLRIASPKDFSGRGPFLLEPVLEDKAGARLVQALLSKAYKLLDSRLVRHIFVIRKARHGIAFRTPVAEGPP